MRPTPCQTSIGCVRKRLCACGGLRSPYTLYLQTLAQVFVATLSDTAVDVVVATMNVLFDVYCDERYDEVRSGNVARCVRCVRCVPHECTDARVHHRFSLERAC